MNLKLVIAGVAARLIGMLPVVWRMEIFRVAANTLGIKYAGFPSHHGIFEAPIYDRVGWIHYVQADLNSGTCDLMRQLFHSGSGTLIDVGANIGLVCIPVKRDVRGIDAYAVEADPENCECFRINAFRAGLTDIVLINRAAYRRECVLDFERSSDNSGDHRIRSGKAKSNADLYDESLRTVTQVQASRLDSLLPASGLKSPVILKCDVQGAEADVLAGATGLLDRIDVIVTEFWPYGLKRAGADINEMMSCFSRFSYGARFDVMDKASIKLLPIAEVVEQLKRFHAEETGIAHCDVVLSKKQL